MVSVRSMLGVALLCLPVHAVAQESLAPDTLPFHRGQWAAQFAGGSSFASLGVLRFAGPTRAWLLDFRFSGGHSHDTSRINDTLVVQGFTSNAAATARIGRRFYQARGKSVASFQTVGALGGYTHQCSGGFGGGSCTNGWNAGAFVDLGGTYLVTPRFGIGGTATLSFSYQRDSAKGTGGAVDKRWAYQAGFQGLSFAATIYF